MNKKLLVLLAILMLVATSAYAVSITLRWTAPADDVGLPTEGLVTAYKLVYMQTPITALNFDAGTVIVTPIPKAPGQAETLITDVPDGKHYYFAIKSVDAQGNWSPLSNMAQRDFMSPLPVADLR